ncbi:DUF6880 family protein [Brevundimonas sp.]|uniref:DUF6880 family protein n=1 Tax=Brevundimonas sp. TaxID=1871086 RepID=UPI002D5FEF81|nr:DUF6880 family protein [Brevundimonas sp.]HYC99293.1 hypothetical protein [Brevundimonas sp.]
MAKRPTTGKKTVSAPNLAALGADRLADLLIEAAAADAGLKRRLRMELAAEVGAADLALEIDKRLAALAGSRARVSWRKRPALISDLRSLLRIITDRLAPLDVRLALDRLVAWFDLYPGLTVRVSDARGELPLLFDAGTADLAAVASSAGPDVAGPLLAEALSTRLNQWASWIGRGAHALDPGLARRLLRDISHGPKPTGRLALVVRKLADRSGDLDAWIHSVPEDDARKPEIGAEIARRLALAGRAAEARAALEMSRATPRPGSRWGRAGQPEPPPDAWSAAEIAVLEAEGRTQDADEARWARFERTLSADDLRAFIARLPDFEDVVATDRAFELASIHPDAMRGLAFLMGWPALREAAALIVARAGEIRGAHDDVPLWAARLAGRHPLAALVLLRARARALVGLGEGVTEEVQALIAEAEVVASAAAGEGVPVEDHAAFVAELHAMTAARRRRW